MVTEYAELLYIVSAISFPTSPVLSSPPDAYPNLRKLLASGVGVGEVHHTGRSTGG